MRFRRIVADVELPEKVEDGYINVRSAERVDVRPGETRKVRTGFKASVPKTQTATLVGRVVVSEELPHGGYKEVFVTIYNPGERNIMVYPGMVIAGIDLGSEKEASKVKKTTMRSTAKLVDRGGWERKPCNGCG